MKIVSTRDISQDILEELRNNLGDEIHADIDTQVALLSAEPPSWFTFIEDADWWIKAFAAYAALYVAEIVREAGKDTWKSRGKALASLRNQADKIRKFAKAISRALSRAPSNTTASVAIPVPDDIYTTSLRLSSRVENEIALEIALFVHHLPAIMDVLSTEGITSGKSSGWVGLRLLDDGAIEVRWFDRETVEEHRHVLPFRLEP